MKQTRDSKLEESSASDNVNFLSPNDTSHKNEPTAGSVQIKNPRKFLPSHKNFKSPQSNTLTTWLKTESASSSSDIQSNQSSKPKDQGNLSRTYNVKKDSSNENEDERQSSSLNGNIIEKGKHAVKKNKKKESQRDRSKGLLIKKQFSENINNNRELKEKRSKSEVKNKSCALKELDIADADMLRKENVARKKFRNIVTSPILFTNSVDEKLNKPQTNTKMKSSKQHSSSSCSSSRKENTKENVITPTKLNKSPETLRRSPRSIKSAKYTLVIPAARKLFENDGTKTVLKKNTEKNNFGTEKVQYSLRFNKSNKTTESSKFSQKNGTEDSVKTNSSTSKTSHRSKQTQKDKIAVTPTKQKENSVDLKSAKSMKSSKGCRSPSVPKKTSDMCPQSSSKQPTWLTKDTTKENNSGGSKRTCKSSTKYNKLDVKINSKLSKKQNSETSRNNASEKKTAMRTLDKYVNKTSKDSNKRKFSRSESNESCEFPSFVKNNKKLKTGKVSDSFQKYGVAVPSVEEILKEQQDLALYKTQIESFKDIDDKFFELPFSVKDLKNTQVINENILGCKHLSNSDIEKAFQTNFDYVSAIFHGKKYSERHERFFEANVRSYMFTDKDLSYNTSTIVFNFEQKELMISLLKENFDPDDKMTLYFFQVLLPELCLKIFMDTHNMTYDEAVKYLDTRPVVD